MLSFKETPCTTAEQCPTQLPSSFIAENAAAVLNELTEDDTTVAAPTVMCGITHEFLLLPSHWKRLFGSCFQRKVFST